TRVEPGRGLRLALQPQVVAGVAARAHPAQLVGVAERPAGADGPRAALVGLPGDEDVIGVDEPQGRPLVAARRTEQVVQQRPAEGAVAADDAVVLAAGPIAPPGQDDDAAALAAFGRALASVVLPEAVRLLQLVEQLLPAGQRPAHQPLLAFLVGRFDPL